jgi:hypothetical protein
MYRRAGKPDSAIAVGERALATSSTGRLECSTNPRGTCSCSRCWAISKPREGDKAKAADYYRTYLQVLKNAEPPVSSEVASVRDRLLKLTGEPGGR